MKSCLIKISIFLIILFVYLCSFDDIFANDDFSSKFEVDYNFLPSGTAKVNLEITLTNNKSESYATSYSLILKEILISDISASDLQGTLKTEVNKQDNQTLIKLFLNQKVVGKGKQLNFNLTYEVKDLAKKIGQIWEINLPQFNFISKNDEINLTVLVPQTYGFLNDIWPIPSGQQFKDNNLILQFSKEDLKKIPVKAIFGSVQVFNFILDYHLKNESSKKATQTIALPPDTERQKVYYQSINILPEKMEVDLDGNWLADYNLKANQKMDIRLSGKVKVYSQRDKYFWHQQNLNLKNNLRSAKYWPVDDPLIKDIAKKIRTPKQIYDFVLKSLSYDYSKARAKDVNRLGAIESLKNPQKAICTEFTDLFITLSRAERIPAREIVGYAQSTDPKLASLNIFNDILHSWPEYYNQETESWTPVDPTWGKTTLGTDYFNSFDLNHFALVIHGQDSEKPLPVSAYKTNEIENKNIIISLGENFNDPKENLEVSFESNQIIIGNNSEMAVYNLEVNINTTGLRTNLPELIKLPVLPPLSRKEINFSIKPSLFKSSNGELEITLNNQTFKKNYQHKSWLIFWLFPLIFILIFLTLRLINVKNK